MLPVLLALAVMAEPAEKFGRVVVAMGMVTAKTGEQGVRALRTGDTVFRGERIATDTDGRAKLLLEDRSVVSLGPKTEMQLEALRSPEAPKTTVKLLFGRLWANVQKIVGADAKFDVSTPNAVAGVRGTSFFAEANGQKSTFSVANGTVAVSSGNQAQLLQALQQINATDSGLSGIINLPPGAVQEMISQLSTAGGLDDSGRLGRLGQLEQVLNPPTVIVNDMSAGGQQNTLPPVNLDPQQTTQTTLIRGRVEVVQP